MEFKDRLEAAMTAASVSRTQLADELGCSGAAIGALLRGESKQMTGENLVKTARLCDVNPYWLATGEGPTKDKFSREARDLAHRIDTLTGKDRRRAIALCKLALFCPIPDDLAL